MKGKAPEWKAVLGDVTVGVVGADAIDKGTMDSMSYASEPYHERVQAQLMSSKAECSRSSGCGSTLRLD